jgi:4-hydroxy-2-oxoheptanedioate aldolase
MLYDLGNAWSRSAALAIRHGVRGGSRYRPNTLKQRLRDGENVLGCWTMLGHPQVVEILSLAGFDYLVLDQEHGLGDATTLAAQLHAMSATPTVGVVRVPWNDHVYLKRVLDVGAEAVLIPSIDTADEARAAVSACLYPPRGRRGTASSSVRASSYGMAPDYVATCADNLLIACQIESARAVENIDAILAVPGIDLMFIGPFDLSATVGQMGNLEHPEVARLITRAEERIRAAGRPMGTVPHPGRTWADMFDRGYQFVNAGSDISRLRDGGVADVKAFRARYRRG